MLWVTARTVRSQFYVPWGLKVNPSVNRGGAEGGREQSLPAVDGHEGDSRRGPVEGGGTVQLSGS